MYSCYLIFAHTLSIDITESLRIVADRITDKIENGICFYILLAINWQAQRNSFSVHLITFMLYMYPRRSVVMVHVLNV